MIDATVAPLWEHLDALTARVATLEADPLEPEPPADYGWAEWYWDQHPELDPRRMDLEPYVITSTADSGSGTLRDAVSQSTRHITSTITGVIPLSSDIVTQADNLILDLDDSLVTTRRAVKFEGTGYVINGLVSRDATHDAKTDNATLRGRSDGPVQVAIVNRPYWRRAADACLDIIYSFGRDVYVSIWDGYMAETDKALLIDSGEPTLEGGRYHVTIGRTHWYDCGQRMPGARNADVHLIDCTIERFGDDTGAGGGATAFAGCNMLVENTTVIPRKMGEVVGFNGQTCTSPRMRGIHPHYNSPGNVRVVNPTLLGGAVIEERNPHLVADPPYRSA